MRVLYDHQIFQEQEFGGISRYFTELYANASEVDAEIALIVSDNQHLLSLPEMRNRIRPFRGEINDWLWGLKFRGKQRLYKFVRKITRRPTVDAINRQNSIARLRSSEFDLFHPTYFNPYFLKTLGNRPFVLTVYDLIHEFFPADFLPEDRTALQKRMLCEKATRIIAISNTTKNDLVKCLGVDPGKIDVVHLGISIKPDQNSTPPSSTLPQKYILFTGTRSGYKNFAFFVRAVSDILRKDNSLKLLCAGRTFTVEERALFHELSITDSTLNRNPSDHELAILYGNAEVFVFPSLYEGFGIPILEAFACGCPAILSDTPAMREVAGSAAVFFDPKSASGLAKAVSRVLEDDALKGTLKEKGHQRAKSFSWEKTAMETADVYRHALECHGRI